MNYRDNGALPAAGTRGPDEELVRKVLESKQFRRAPKLRALLEYLAERSLQPEPVEIRESEIGCRLYGRPPGYDSSSDSIVRVEVRNLRRKLEEYFQGEGAAEPVQITIPKGNYRLRFSARSPEDRPAEPARMKPARGAFRSAVLAAAAGALLAAPVGLLLGRWLFHSASLPAAPKVELPLWSRLFDGKHNTYIVVSDSIWSEGQYIFRRNYGLADYLRLRGISADPPVGWNGLEEEAKHIFSRQYTSIADVQLVARILALPGLARERVSVRFARNMQLRDFNGNNAVVLGSYRSNPWAELFQKNLNFQFEFDKRLHRPLFRNRAPAKGERPLYVARGEDGSSDEIYAHAALVPNPSGDGDVLLISGTLMEGTEAIGEFLTSPRGLANVVRSLKLEQGGHLRYFEFLIQSSFLEGGPGPAEVVAYRLLPAKP